MECGSGQSRMAGLPIALVCVLVGFPSSQRSAQHGGNSHVIVSSFGNRRARVTAKSHSPCQRVVLQAPLSGQPKHTFHVVSYGVNHCLSTS